MIYALRGRAFDRSPMSMFTLLMLTQGYTLGGESVDAIEKAWKALLATSPFGDVDKLDPAKVTFGAYGDKVDDDLGLVQTGSVLEIDIMKKSRLRDYLEQNKIAIPVLKGKDPEVPCIDIWPEQGRFGRVGSLVAIIKKGTQAGELYQITSTNQYPVPLVAVVATGANWTNVIVRGVAQTFANLADEYELPGPDFQKAPIQLIEPRPNVIVINDGQRTLLANGTTPTLAGVSIPGGWGMRADKPVTFRAHAGDSPNVDLSRRAGTRQTLIEGAAGFRFNALRCDEDCLMRRQPNSTALPIQAAGVSFCMACENALRTQVNNWQSTDFGRRPRILLDGQRPLVDSVRWKKELDKPTTVHTPFTFQVGTKAKWSASVDIDADLGLRLQSVELKDRPGDPFAAATTVFSTIGFKDLKVKFAGEPERALKFADAFATAAPNGPELKALEDGNGENFLGALRLRLDWHIAGHYSIQGILSVVFKDSASDFDPGGAAIGNKIYPQIALRYRKRISEKGTMAKVEWLSGSIHLVCGNVFKTDMQVNHELHHMLSGKQQIVLAVDSNATDFDNEYTWDKEDAGEWLGENCSSAQVPSWGLWGGEWKSGRLLADVVDPSMIRGGDTYAAGHAGATARRGHLDANLPGLPHWSWLFDYVTPLALGVKRFVGVYRRGEATPVSPDGGADRRVTFTWPVAADKESGVTDDFTMTVAKIARQGAFDSIHVHPKMGSHGTHEVTPAPFCADLCIHLHVRWGVVALGGQIPNAPGTINRPLYLGWGMTGRLDQGAYSSLGAPLVPPNQHLEIAVNHLDTNSEVTYIATAHDPDQVAYQVFLEQGTGVLFSYDGLDLAQVAQLAGAVRVFNPRTINDHRDDLRAQRASDPAACDRAVRNLFHEIYDRIRWYHDKRIKDDVQQVPGEKGVPAALENL
jgi:hypothetical protein